MQLGQRELSLHKIIKTQQAKIKELEQQLHQNNGIQMIKLESNLKEANIKLQQKQKQCTTLTNQLNKLKQEIRQSQQYLKHSRERQRQCVLTQNKHLIMKVKELQDRLRIQIQRSELDVNKILRLNSTLQKQVYFYKSNLSSIELQIQKLQIFYRNALAELPRRTQTLQWVANFIKFINQYQQSIEKHPLHNEIEKIKAQLQNCNQEFTNKKNQMILQNEQKNNELRKYKDQIQTIISGNIKQQEAILEENKIFWQMIKKEKNDKSVQSEKKIEEQYSHYKRQYERINNELTKRVKELEIEKKDMLLAIQQLKLFYQNKQKNHRQQIKILKKAEEKLIQYGQNRQKTFQKEMKQLMSQVDQLTARYDNNIKIPFEEYNQRFKQQITNMMQEIKQFPYRQKFAQILNRLDMKTKEVDSFIQKNNQKNIYSIEYMQKNLMQLENIQKNINSNLKLISAIIDQYGDSGGHLILSDQLYQKRILKLEKEEQDSRKFYELNLLKKNYNKLLDINSKLQDRLNKKSIEQKQQESMVISQRIIELESEKNILVQEKQKYEFKFLKQLKKLKFAKYDQQILMLIAENLREFQSNLQDIKKFNRSNIFQIFSELKDKQEQYLEQIKDSYSQIMEFIQNPIKRIETLIANRSKLQQQSSNFTLGNNPHTISKQSGSSKTQVNLDLADEIKKYKQIISSKNQSNSSITKILNQLIVKIKTSLPLKQIKLEQNNQEKALKKPKIEMQIQKRIRDIQTARLKQKNQLNTGLEKLNIMIKKLQNTKGKSDRYFDGLNRIEVLLKQKIEFMITLLENPAKQKKFNELNIIAKKAITDLEAKLKESVYENEGLMKQLKLITNFNKSFKQV